MTVSRIATVRVRITLAAVLDVLAFLVVLTVMRAGPAKKDTLAPAAVNE